MSAPPLPERLAILEDEVQAMDSRVDARTRRIWQELELLRAEIGEFRKWLQAQEVGKSCRS